MTREEHIDKLVADAKVRLTLCFNLHDSKYAAEFAAGIGGNGRLTNVRVTAPGAVACGIRGYWSTLHELGHIAAYREHPEWPPQSNYTHDHTALMHEAFAWRWAIEHSVEPLDAEARAHIAYCMGTYRTHAKKGAMDKPEAADFCKLLAEMEA